jgi:hypothetical protein
MERKTVCLPIEVPSGKYCWHFKIDGICSYFNNEGGYPSCDLKFDVKNTKKGILKDLACERLKKVC